MRQRLRRLGITGHAARNTAALQLAKTLPALAQHHPKPTGIRTYPQVSR